MKTMRGAMRSAAAEREKSVDQNAEVCLLRGEVASREQRLRAVRAENAARQLEAESLYNQGIPLYSLKL